MEPIQLTGIKKLLMAFPFLIVSSTGKEPHLNIARVVEAVIIALVAGSLSAYITLKEISTKVEAMGDTMKIMDSRIYEHRLWHLERAEQHENIKDHPGR